MTNSRFCVAASLITVSLLVAPFAGAETPHSAKSAHPAGAPGSELRGGKRGTTQRLADGVKLHLAAGARVRFERGTRLELGRAGQPSTPALSLDLLAGRIEVDVPAARSPRLAVLVHAPRHVSAVIKGGRGIVMTARRGVTVAAARGEMLAAVGNEWKPLPEGMARTIGPADAAGRPRAMPGATHVAVSSPLLVSLDGKARSTTAVWLPVRGAARYDVSVSRPGGGVVRVLHTSTHTTRLDGLAPGRYEVQVQPVDRFGLEGPVSAPDTVRVIGVRLPPGSFVSGGSVMLGSGQRARFTHTSGVLVSYDAASTYIPAPLRIGLARGHATRIRFREAGTDRDQATVRLAPRALSAHIEIGPRLARWPADKVTVTLRVVDDTGRKVPAWVKLEPRVAIDVTPVDVHWTRRDNVLRGVVPAPSGPGPWVVRVEVKDQFGEELGRNFLEIATSAARVASAR